MIFRFNQGEKKISLFLFLAFCFTGFYSGNIHASEGEALGPLGGRNMYAAHVPWFSFPGESAAAETAGTVRIKQAAYYLNDFYASFTDPDNPDHQDLDENNLLLEEDQDKLTVLDYESAIYELSAQWQYDTRWRFNADWRLHYRYGGVMDSFLEWFHHTTNLPNAGREFFYQNRSQWTIQSRKGIDYSGEGPVLSSGDLDFRTIYTIHNTSRLSFAAGAALKLPLGNKDMGFSSGYPDLGMQFLTDWRPLKRWIFYANLGGIVPLDSKSSMMEQFIPAVEFRASEGLSLILQMNIQSFPLTADRSYDHYTFGRVDVFELPQTDMKIGMKGRNGRLGWEFYVEEDTFTWEGPDILVFLGASWDFR